MKKVLILNGGFAYQTLFATHGYKPVNHFKDLVDCDLVCFTGGEDVSPHLYGDKAHQYTGSNRARDAIEREMFEAARVRGIPMVGICRGGQFLNVMSGGRMYQHVSEHTREHMITDVRTGRQVFVSSTHHQMMMPSEQAEIIAYANLGGTREWYDGEVFRRDVSNTDYEVVFYDHTKSLCFQPHPEFFGAEFEDMQDYFFSLIEEKLYAHAA